MEVQLKLTTLLLRAKSSSWQLHPLLPGGHRPFRNYLLPAAKQARTRKQFRIRAISSMAALIEASKRRAAYKAVADHFHPSYRCIGIGSGSTVIYVVQAIAEIGSEITSKMVFIPTGEQSKQLILDAGLPLGSMATLPLTPGRADERISLDVAFDGADEIDEELNCIKGGGACLLQEKLVATSAKIFVCVADSRKLQRRLLSSWKTIPIEVLPLAAPKIQHILRTLGSPDPKLRQGTPAKAGPVVTDNGNWIIDAPFLPLLNISDLTDGNKGDGENGIWEVRMLGDRLNRIVGVVEVGLFYNLNGIQASESGAEGQGQKPVAAYFGMENGEVEVRLAKEIKGLNTDSSLTSSGGPILDSPSSLGN